MTTSRVGGVGGIDDNSAQAGYVIVQPLALRGRDGGAQLEVGPEGGPYNALRAGDGGSSRQSLVCITGDRTHALTSEGADASEDGTGRGTPIIAYAPDVAAPLTRGSAASPGVNPPGRRQEDDVNLVAQTVLSLAVAGDFSSGDDVAQTIRAAHGQPGVVSIDMRNAVRSTETGQSAGTGIGEEGAPSYTLSATKRALPAVGYDTVVRRLTELECERLQGYPDGWTDGQSGSARYRQLGDSVAVPVVEWIARRLIAVDGEVTS